ncbi:MAG: xanthine dehydrogenase family protein molybdopterin-binding subunit [Pseudomonadales bacterium]|nr:xanthine dehydrogenase family protein molybdopterin-binding subunit [Pseudomonadales bacterium]
MPLPESLERNPRLDDWIQFERERIIVRTGKVELGQGIATAIAMIAAEELEVSVEQIQVRTGNTAEGPNEFLTAGSMSIETSGAAVRQVCAEVRALLMARAAERLGVPLHELSIVDGIVRHTKTNHSASWFELAGESPFGVDATGRATPRPFESYRLIGRTTTRIDLRDRFTGRRAFIQDEPRDGLLHGRIVRGPSVNHMLAGIDTVRASRLPGIVNVVVDGGFVGVVAVDEFTASRARALLARDAQWKRQGAAPSPDPVSFLQSNADDHLLVVDGTPVPGPLPPRETGENTLRATYFKPYHMHGSIGPSAAVATFTQGKLRIKSHSQGPSVIRDSIAAALDMSPGDISVRHVGNAGCYGHNGADDAAMDAAMLAIATPGRTILLKWEREDEHRYEPYSPAMVMQMEASLSADRITHWNADIYSQTHSGRPMPHRSVSNLIAAWHKSSPLARAESRPGLGNHSGIHRNADPYYSLPSRRIIKHLVRDQGVRTSSTRGLGAFGNVFAIESFMDELAHAAGIDPVDFRLAHLADNRAEEVIRTAVSLSAAFEPPDMPNARIGRGLAFARYKNRQTYAAVVICLAVNEETLRTTLLHGAIAADAGQVIDRDGLANQLEGGVLQAASWTLKEAVTFDDEATTSVDWETYPILRFSEVPEVDVAVLDRPGSPSLGAGEATQGPTPAAIANAIFNATGVRLRRIPFTPDALRQAAMRNEP